MKVLTLYDKGGDQCSFGCDVLVALIHNSDKQPVKILVKAMGEKSEFPASEENLWALVRWRE